MINTGLINMIIQFNVALTLHGMEEKQLPSAVPFKQCRFADNAVVSAKNLQVSVRLKNAHQCVISALASIDQFFELENNLPVRQI